MPSARVILATYNQVPLLRLVLSGYLRQTTNDFTLVLADDGSGSEQTNYIERMVPVFAERGVRLESVWHEDRGWRKNHIFNEAVRRTGDESLLIFSDADCIPPSHFVERHLAVYEPWSFHVGGAYRLTKSESEALTEGDISRGSFENLGSKEDRKALRTKKRESYWGTLVRRRNRPKVIGLNMGFDRRLIEAVNGFDEVFRSPYLGEDTDLRDRVMRCRPRPLVKVLYTENDVFHLWHPLKETDRSESRSYYEQERPMRCIRGLEDLS